MEEVPGGVSRVHGCNAYANYRGKAGKKADSAKHKGTLDHGKDLSGDATNPIGIKRTNEMLSPGPKPRRHY